MENINIVLAANILKYRKKSGLSQEELANKLGVTFQAVSKWELAKSAPDISFLPTMADVFECSIDDLFSYMPKCKREEFNILPGDSVPEGMKNYLSDQIKSQFDNNGSTNRFLEIMAENLSGEFELTDENIERLLDAYREMYRGMRNKKKYKVRICCVNTKIPNAKAFGIFTF